jgi:hypothetical protein
MNARFYTLRDVTRLQTGGCMKFLRITAGNRDLAEQWRMSSQAWTVS